MTGKDKEILLSATKTSDATGKSITDAVDEAIKNFSVERSIIDMSFDTTNSNFGRNKGAAVLIEASLEQKFLYLPCRHHIYDLIVKEACKLTFDYTIGPSSPIFETFRSNWQSIKNEVSEKLEVEDQWLLNKKNICCNYSKKYFRLLTMKINGNL